MKNLVLSALAMAICMIVTEAYAQEVMQPLKNKIWFAGEKSYAEKVASFKLSSSDIARIVARKRMDIFIHQDILYGHLRRHWFIVDNFYVLSDIRRNKSDFPLQGIYVNGNTGEVWYRFTDEVVSPEQFPKNWLRKAINLDTTNSGTRSERKGQD